MRHGEAGLNTFTDSQRTLTERGNMMAFEQGKWLAKRLIEQKVNLDAVFVSPYIRAQQTWFNVIKGMQAAKFEQNFAKITENWQGITPSSNAQLVVDYLETIAAEKQNVFLISHLPLVFDLVQHLTQFQYSVHFYPAVIAEINYQDQQGKLIISQVPH
ncbi:phosphohistidine phosphatase SixA [Nicoletella semolina]|uniref:Phosphohistidine phosphatase SixA n=2 Tax=Nicoletella semolina TaxID=271160 RepID=A0A4R2NCR6_9PAST|nr:phosphohistidine phosphatase SixA [Nicoletella semolina]